MRWKRLSATGMYSTYVHRETLLEANWERMYGANGTAGCCDEDQINQKTLSQCIRPREQWKTWRKLGGALLQRHTHMNAHLHKHLLEKLRVYFSFAEPSSPSFV